MRLRPHRLTMGAALIGAALAFGCRKADAEDEPAVVPKAVAFEGQVDSKFAGAWTSANAGSILDLEKDGSATITTAIHSQNGKSTATNSGHWLVSGSDLVLRYADASRNETTVKYAAKLSGNTLELQQPGGRLKTTYTKK